MVGVLKQVLAHGLVFGLGTAGVIWARVAALRPDPEAERVLNSPGVIEKALARARDDSSDGGDGKPPLVAAAEAFALYLNPPAPPTAKRPVPRQRAAPPKPPPVTSMPRFRLLGISYHRAKPAESRASIAGNVPNSRSACSSGSISPRQPSTLLPLRNSRLALHRGRHAPLFAYLCENSRRKCLCKYDQQLTLLDL